MGSHVTCFVFTAVSVLVDGLQYEGWPLRWGIGILQGIEAAHRHMNSHTAVECSFMAPGLGPWRPDMAPYVDEHGPDLVALGLKWHSKMLLRIEIAGTIIVRKQQQTNKLPPALRAAHMHRDCSRLLALYQFLILCFPC
jgi:hypothetical protein